jgi:hypothetical protein
MPKLAIAVLLLGLVTLASTLSYTGYLVVGAVAEHLGLHRLMAGLLLGVLFARLPWVAQRKLRTIGLLPKRTRQPVMVALLTFCLLSYSYRGELVPVLFLAFAGAFLLTYPWMRKIIVGRVTSFVFPASIEPSQSRNADNSVIDVEFREKKD